MPAAENVLESLRRTYRTLRLRTGNDEERTLARIEASLRGRSRYQPGTIRVDGAPLHFTDAASLLSAWEEIFVGRCYEFTEPPAPDLILDVGANIGLSTRFFLGRYPSARVVAFEPDPALFACLERNVAEFGPDRVELQQAAVWREAGELPFYAEGADGGRLSAGPEATLTVPAVTLDRWLDAERIDLLKIDVEGAEGEILESIAGRLGAVQRLFVEYHSQPGEPQRLDRILAIFGSAGMRYHVQPVLISPRPFAEVHVVNGFDLQLNLFAWRTA